MATSRPSMAAANSRRRTSAFGYGVRTLLVRCPTSGAYASANTTAGRMKIPRNEVAVISARNQPRPSLLTLRGRHRIPNRPSIAGSGFENDGRLRRANLAAAVHVQTPAADVNQPAGWRQRWRTGAVLSDHGGRNEEDDEKHYRLGSSICLMSSPGDRADSPLFLVAGSGVVYSMQERRRRNSVGPIDLRPAPDYAIE